VNRVDPLFSYLSILAVIQPARIQDIEAYAERLLGVTSGRVLVDGGLLRTAHDIAREKGYVFQVRRGVYFTAAKARHLVRREGLERSIDNRRLFLMKAQRRRYK
jgi:ABC-type uncharacterized transport system ATPase subunit